MESHKTWTVIELINWCAHYLHQRHFKAPKTNTELLLAHTLGVDRLDLYLNYNRTLTAEELERFRGFFKRRLDNEPIQYITGATEFMSLPFRVDPGVFIPRPETELLVETIIDKVQTHPISESLRILDVGTGTGCIAVSLAKYLPNVDIIATDINQHALDIARGNAELNHVTEKIQFLHQSILNMSDTDPVELDIVVSNPPYVSQAIYQSLDAEIVNYEPAEAVSDFGDGCSFYPVLCEYAAARLQNGGWIAVEIGEGESGRVRNIFLEFGFENINIRNDYAAIPRIITGCKQQAKNK